MGRGRELQEDAGCPRGVGVATKLIECALNAALTNELVKADFTVAEELLPASTESHATATVDHVGTCAEGCKRDHAAAAGTARDAGGLCHHAAVNRVQLPQRARDAAMGVRDTAGTARQEWGPSTAAAGNTPEGDG